MTAVESIKVIRPTGLRAETDEWYLSFLSSTSEFLSRRQNRQFEQGKSSLSVEITQQQAATSDPHCAPFAVDRFDETNRFSYFTSGSHPWSRALARVAKPHPLRIFHRHCEERSCPPKPAFGRRRMRRSNPSRGVRGFGLLRSSDGALRQHDQSVKITELARRTSRFQPAYELRDARGRVSDPEIDLISSGY